MAIFNVATDGAFTARSNILTNKTMYKATQ
jgi:hypothetical protein